MELFLPSLLIILLSGFLVFGIIPRFSPFVIFVLCVAFLLVSCYIHYSMFSGQYKNMFSSGLTGVSKDVVFTIPGISVNIPTLLLTGLLVVGLLFAILNLSAGLKFNPSSFRFDRDPDHLKVISSRRNEYPHRNLERIEEQL